MVDRQQDGVTKLKPIQTPRTLDERTVERAERAKESIKSAKTAVVRSRELVKRSQEVIGLIKKRRGGADGS